MSEIPILQSIHDKFDTFPQGPYADHSNISSIKIKSRPDGYSITTYPGGIGSLYDGFVIDVSAHDGIYGDVLPHRVQTARNFGPTMALQVADIYEDRLEMVNASLAPLEGLVLPGDEGFTLFESLHQQLHRLRPVMEQSVAGFHPMEGQTLLEYRDNSTDGARVDQKSGVVVFRGETKYRVGVEEKTSMSVTLNAQTPVPYDIESGRIPAFHFGDVVYESGKAFIFLGRTVGDGIKFHALERDELNVFNGVRNVIKDLYTMRKS